MSHPGGGGFNPRHRLAQAFFGIGRSACQFGNKLVDDGQYAERVNVMLGASSVNEIEVIEGLEEGDIVILSDMSNWDGFDRVRLRN